MTNMGVYTYIPNLETVLVTYSGVILEPNWDSGGNRLETVMVSRVEEGGVADHCGVWEGDEVVRVNGRPVKEAGWVGTRSALDGEIRVKDNVM